MRTVPARCLGRAAGTSRAAGRAVQVGDAEGQVQGLAAVQPGVARGLVPVAQVGFGDVLAAADALGDVVAGELDVDAARVPAERAVHLEEPRSPRPARRRSTGSCGRWPPRPCCRASGRTPTRLRTRWPPPPRPAAAAPAGSGPRPSG